ncbi:HDOD domain-containing protein [bacterium]|nr:HDOD domain-containing protein [bacterium]MBU1993499.1 HDOD domain-containing protein [bacterium]
MISKNTVDSYIDKIPPSPQALKETLRLLDTGELIKAAKVAQTDLALKAYLKSLVNRPVYGFAKEVSDVSQIFGILGVSGSQQAVYNYLLTLLSPKKWLLFKLNSSSFYELQARLSRRWKDILEHLKINDKNIESAITLLPASIIVSEALFCEKITDVNLLRSVKNLDLNTILFRLCRVDLFDICELIAAKWEMPEKVSKIVNCASGIKPSDDESINLLGKWMHLLLFYELSQPMFVEAGLNDFVDFQVDYVSDIYEEFSSVAGLS